MLLEKLKITDTFKQWRDKLNVIIESYSGVPSTDDNGVLTIDRNTTQADEFKVTIPTTFTDDVTFNNVVINGELDATVESANHLTNPIEINGVLFDGSENITTTKWGVSRNIKIGDATKSNYGTVVSVDGSTDYTFTLPSTIKATLSGNATTATTLKTTRSIDGVSFNGSANISHYAICNTSAGSQVKVVSLSNFTLTNGATVTIKFMYGNTASSPMLNVNNTGSIAIYSNNAVAETSIIKQYAIITFVYDGSVFNVVSGDDTKVTQLKNSENKSFPIVFSATNDTSLSTITSSVNYSDSLVYNPSTKTVSSTGTYLANGGFIIKKTDESWNTVPSETKTVSYLSYRDNSDRQLFRLEFQKYADGTVLNGFIVPKHNTSGEENWAYMKVGYDKGSTPVLTTSCNITATGTITGSLVYNAVWNDYAEFFPKGEETEAGDIIALDTSSKKERYVKATNTSKLIVGIHSDTYGHILGGEGSIEESLKTNIPVGLTGRVYVNFIGEAILGEAIVPSEVPGCGKLYNEKENNPRQIVGYIVEDEIGGIQKRKVKVLIGK